MDDFLSLPRRTVPPRDLGVKLSSDAGLLPVGWRPASETTRRQAVEPASVAEIVRTALGVSLQIDAATPLISSGLEEVFEVTIPVDAIDGDTFDTPEQIATIITEAETS